MKSRFFIILIFISSQVFAQDDIISGKSKALDFYKKGEEALLQLDYEKAIRQFEKALKIQPDLYVCHRAMGVSLFGLDRYREAADHYEELIKRKPNFSRVLYYDMATAAYKSGQYQKALDYFLQFESLQAMDIITFGYNGNKEKEIEFGYLQKLADNINACKSALDQIKYTENIEVENLGDAINTKGDEYFPYLTNSQQTLFYTSKRNNRADENLFLSKYAEDSWQFGKAVQDSFNTAFNEGMSTLTHDGQQMFFTSCGLVRNKIDCNIKTAQIDKDSIVSTSKLKGYLNTEKWESQATISCDGSMIFFSSNRVGGFGGTDIWYSKKQADGSWAEPQNAGNGVNTILDEEAPFISRDGSTLYFSSTGHLGLGGQDIFYSRLNNNGKWDQAVNLGHPINTAYRELGFFVSVDGKDGFFSSNREGGIGGMDIYKFELTENLNTKAITYVEGYVKDAKSKDAIQTVLNAKADSPIITDEQGRFFICLEAEKDFDIRIEEKEYKVYTDKERIPVWNNKEFYKLNIFLEPVESIIPVTKEIKPIKSIEHPVNKPKASLNSRQSIYFEFDKYNIDSESMQKLDAFISKLKNQNIQSLEIHAYCDYRGTDVYNKELADRRANSVADYLSQKNIIANKVISFGHGELPASDALHLDRRVDVVIRY